MLSPPLLQVHIYMDLNFVIFRTQSTLFEIGIFAVVYIHTGPSFLEDHGPRRWENKALEKLEKFFSLVEFFNCRISVFLSSKTYFK